MCALFASTIPFTRLPVSRPCWIVHWDKASKEMSHIDSHRSPELNPFVDTPVHAVVVVVEAKNSLSLPPALTG